MENNIYLFLKIWCGCVFIYSRTMRLMRVKIWIGDHFVVLNEDDDAIREHNHDDTIDSVNDNLTCLV